MSLTRRTMLGGIAATAAPLPAIASDEPALPSLEERRDLLVAELAAVLQALTSTVWDVRNNRELGVVVMVDTRGKMPEEKISTLGMEVSWRAHRAGV